MSSSTSSNGTTRRSLLKSAGFLLGSSMMMPNISALAMNSPSASASGSAGPATATKPDGSPLMPRQMIGFMLAHEQFAVPELVQLGANAEEAGFDLLATSDHLQPWQSNEGHSGQAWVTMAALGERTKKIWIGPTVTCPSFRYNPAVVAEAFASLNLLYPGRIFLGIGSGEALNEEAATGSWPKWPERSDRLIEASQIIRQMWTGQQVNHAGKYYNVNAKLFDPPTSQIPLLMAANVGPKAMNRSGQYGDGLITDPKTWSEHKSDFEAGAKAANKDPRQMPVLVEQFVVVGDKNDARDAAALWQFIPKAFKSYFNVRDPQVIQQSAAEELPIEKVYGDWFVSSDPDEHVQGIAALINSGATIVNIHSGQADQLRVIDFYGNRVLPKLRRHLSQSV